VLEQREHGELGEEGDQGSCSDPKNPDLFFC